MMGCCENMWVALSLDDIVKYGGAENTRFTAGQMSSAIMMRTGTTRTCTSSRTVHFVGGNYNERGRGV